MMASKMGFALVAALGLVCCTQKPKPVAQAEPPPPAMAKAETPPAPVDTLEKHRLRIQELLNEAFQPVYFPFDQANLSEQTKSLLAKAGALMQQEESIQVLIQGNTDERGTEAYNLALGDRRAQAVKAYLVSYGVDASRLKVISYGAEKPAKAGHGEAVWAMNRRDEFNVTF